MCEKNLQLQWSANAQIMTNPDTPRGEYLHWLVTHIVFVNQCEGITIVVDYLNPKSISECLVTLIVIINIFLSFWCNIRIQWLSESGSLRGSNMYVQVSIEIVQTR